VVSGNAGPRLRYVSYLINQKETKYSQSIPAEKWKNKV
jgi:hypothetical protein